MSPILFIAVVFVIMYSVCALTIFAYITYIADRKGAPFTRSAGNRIRTMLKLSSIQPNENIVDFGSGDGSILIEAAKLGANAVGVEINPFLVLFSRYRIRRKKLDDRITVVLGDFRKYSLRDVHVVFLYLLPGTLGRLRKKLQDELTAGSRVVSNAYPIPEWDITRKENSVFLHVVS